MEVIINGIKYVPENNQEVTNPLTVIDVLIPYVGTKEYDGVVAVIQKWYYGSVVKAAWCATCMSWALAQLGLLKKTLGTKQENVYYFEKALKEKGVAQVPVKQARRGDIVILHTGGTWGPGASKHVTACYSYNQGSTMDCLGGNQSDQIKVKSYSLDVVRSVWRPAYGTGGVNNLNHLPKL